MRTSLDEVGGFTNDATAGSLRRLARPVLRSDVLLVAFDLLSVWDVLAVAVASRLSTFAYMALCDGGQIPGAAAPFDSVLIATIGSVLAFAILRSRPARTAFHRLSTGDLLSTTCQRLTLWAALVFGAIFLSHSGGALPRIWVSLWMVLSFAAVVAARPLAIQLLRGATRRGMLRDRVAVVGEGLAAERLLRRLRDAAGAGVELACVVIPPCGTGREFERAAGHLMALGRGGRIDRVVLALPGAMEARVLDVVRRLQALDIEVSHCPPDAGLPGETLKTAEIGGMPVIVLASRPFGHGGLLFKSLFDRLVALAAIVFLAPFLLLVAVAVWLESPGPVIFRQARHGWNDTEFQVFKFRTMRWQPGPGGDGTAQTRRGDSRLTRVGAILRATSVDELPQFINVLNGTMSLVGPRPHPVVMRTENRLGGEIIAEYSHRHRVKPGITGWAQIHGLRGATATADQVRRRVEHDLYYIDNWSFLLDLRILVVTLFKVVFPRGTAF